MNEQQAFKNNRLLQSSSYLISLMIVTKRSFAPKDLHQIQRDFVKALNDFKVKTKELDCHPRHILAAHYCLCATIDEFVLNTKWGRKSFWVDKSILSSLYQETWGGANFYVILERMLQQPNQHFEVLEFLYVLLSLGFQGKYYGKHSLREKIKNQVYRSIATRLTYESDLSPHARPKELIRQDQESTLPVLSWSFMVLAFTGAIYSIYFLGIGQYKEPLMQTLTHNSRLLNEEL